MSSSQDAFNARELGDWEERLRPSFLALPGDMPAALEEMKQLPLMKRSWKSRLMLLRLLGHCRGYRGERQHLEAARVVPDADRRDRQNSRERTYDEETMVRTHSQHLA